MRGNDCSLWKTIRPLLRSGRFSLVHAHGLTAAAHAALAGLGRETPLLVTLHEPLRDAQFAGLAGSLKRTHGPFLCNLERVEFSRRFRESFVDPAFRSEDAAIGRLETIAWDAYCDGRKSPLTRKAGAGYADPDYDLSVDYFVIGTGR